MHQQTWTPSVGDLIAVSNIHVYPIIRMYGIIIFVREMSPFIEVLIHGVMRTLSCWEVLPIRRLFEE